MEEVSAYQSIGGDAALRQLVDRFYDLMDTTPAFERIRSLHPADLTGSRDKLYLFLTGWLGGPPIYVEKYGHPRLRARHLPFSIGEEERDQWMACMILALEDCAVEPQLSRQLTEAFWQTADFMRNREG